MRRRPHSPTRLLPDGTPLRNRLLAALPATDYKRVATHLRLQSIVTGEMLHSHGRLINDVYFPNDGVFSITNRMRDGATVEVATVGREGMLGVGVFLGDRSRTGPAFQKVVNGLVAALPVSFFVRETSLKGTFRELMALYAQATLLQSIQCTACNALHDVTQRCCRWLLQTHDRMDADDFPLKHEFLALMLGVHPPQPSPSCSTRFKSPGSSPALRPHARSSDAGNSKRRHAVLCSHRRHYVRLGPCDHL
jgi:CRP-like cAMP-binding protein